MMRGKKGFEFSFGWMFAIIVGAMIIFLAIYAAVRLVSTERVAQDTASAKELEIILTPVETGFESAKAVAPIRFPSDTRIFNNCSAKGSFGEQEISIASSLGLGKKWQKPGVPVLFYNKYIFSSRVAEGKEFYVFSKPFSLPYKVADIMVMWTNKERYCFVNAPNEIADEVKKLGLRNIDLNESLAACIKGSRKVCFYSDLPNCDMIVSPEQKIVTKRTNESSQTVSYEGNLIYGAIFADPMIYECQVQRLMKRTAELALLYSSKSEIISAKSPSSCSLDMQGELGAFALLAAATQDSASLRGLSFSSETMNSKNKNMKCPLWGES
ncbi:MAG: hypothetical protein MUF61_02715 [archaeon]|jgi:hypothetical protein|nr:hypothetical protein [archaeon]